MEPETQPEETSEEPKVITIGDASELTEGTTNRSGPEDKRYKYT
ncbi:albusnodin family lasso peptide [Streptomonospora sp. S1-112]|uniref:Albusnodin family lasso peptide n=1 Tax=Streptomonospora mangrovi TaxID=2883123 RepID=A0A9X3NQY7_9ACTN|nr:albusnodin family lasso peptide [Streptomonospora mangrovi]MDA0566763.1 albusnodin family lasso peptide [Streptomonospora mangrovi]